MPEPVGLALGAAQLGMPYGVANRTGQPDEREARRILRLALESGIRLIDTAGNYGQSEAVLGRCLADLSAADKFKVVSKLDPGLDPLAPGAMRAALEASLARLGLPSLYGLLLHDEKLLYKWSSLRPLFDALKEQGLIKLCGVSVYGPEMALLALDCPGLGLLQLPANPLDRRFERAFVLKRAQTAGVRLVLRSVFLQGLLLLDPQEVPSRLAYALPYLTDFHNFCRDAGLSASQVCLGCALCAWPGAEILVGVETSAQLKANLEAARPLPKALYAKLTERFADVPENVLNPSLWPKD